MREVFKKKIQSPAFVVIEKLSDWNENWCGSRYESCDYDSGDKKTNIQKG